MTKGQFVQQLGTLLCAAGIKNVSSMEYGEKVYDEENNLTYAEAVTISFTPFYAASVESKIVVNVSMCGCWGILQDIVERLKCGG